MAYEKLRVEHEGDIAVVTIDNPKANALSGQVIEELSEAFRELKHDHSVRAIVLTGAGRMFVAGADIGELNELGPMPAKGYARKGQHLMTRIEMSLKPVIAAVNGYALGGGCELAMACTVRIASDAAQFGQPEVKLGLIPGFGGTQRLPRLVAPGIALELLLTGRNVDAEEALKIGLVNKVVSGDKLMDEAMEMASTMAKAGPVAVRLAKEAALRGLSTDLSQGMRIEADLFSACFGTEDAREGTGAFLEKRAPEFKGR